MDIQEERKPLSSHDQMYQSLSLGEQKLNLFPIHEVLVESIKKEWRDSEKKPSFSKSLKRRFPIDEDFTPVSNPELERVFL